MPITDAGILTAVIFLLPTNAWRAIVRVPCIVIENLPQIHIPTVEWGTKRLVEYVYQMYLHKFQKFHTHYP